MKKVKVIFEPNTKFIFGKHQEENLIVTTFNIDNMLSNSYHILPYMPKNEYYKEVVLSILN